MEIVYKKLSELKPYENNPRFNDDSVQYVANSIREFGFKVPIIIDRNNQIVAGHTRYKDSIELGLDEVPCIIADDLTDEQVKAFRLADNKVGEKSLWNNDFLNEELDALADMFDMNDFGFAIRIEDIDLEEEAEPEVPIARELGEANNYVVLEFFTEDEWEEAILKLGLVKVSTSDKNKNIRRYGIGRVIKGADVLERLSVLEDEN